MDMINRIETEFKLSSRAAEQTVKLMEEGATIPFIARYRKEVTDGLDEEQLRAIKDRLEYLKDLELRKQTILKTIEEQGKLTPQLKEKILTCMEKTVLEDLYLPYKPKRKTKAAIAKEKGLEPLIETILNQKKGGDLAFSLEAEAAKYIDEENGVKTQEEALKGASDIFAEQIAEDSNFRAFVREEFLNAGSINSKVKKDYANQKTKFEMYYDYQTPLQSIPSHNLLAIRRGEKEGIITYHLSTDDENNIKEIALKALADYEGEVHSFLFKSIADGYSRLLKMSIAAELRSQKKKEADLDAILIFEKNLKELMLAAPAGRVPVMAIDPGFRSGCKAVCLDNTGKYLQHATIYPNEPQKQVEKSAAVILELMKQYNPQFVAIGNGTASRETFSFVRNTLKGSSFEKSTQVVMVSEAGASVYSASPGAKKEFPDLDVTIRGAISIGRRLIDPLAELVKIDSKSIGVGQYQHDVDQNLLKKKLDEVVESCVNYVGVDINSASKELLAYVSGVSPRIAGNIIKFRDEQGAFKERKTILKVTGIGPKVFEQAAGFLRIHGGDNPLDNTAVHPESYDIVAKIAKFYEVALAELCGNQGILNKIDGNKFVDEERGLDTLKDILDELKKPGRDPRAAFENVSFREDVLEIKDLQPGMWLNGVVTNVTHFGAFVDIGVHQDGLVHISKLADRFVNDPNKIVKVGQRVSVGVVDVDLELKRIALTMRKGDDLSTSKPQKNKTHSPRKMPSTPTPKKESKGASLQDLANRWKL